MSYETILFILMGVLVACVLVVFVRLARRKMRFQDRVIALDLMTTLGVGIIALYSMATGEHALMDVAIIVALLSFLGTVAFAYYGERMFRQ